DGTLACTRHARRPALSRAIDFSVAESTQAERQNSDLLRMREQLGLTRRQFQSGGFADDRVLVLLLMRGLIDREHSDIVENRQSLILLCAACGGQFVSEDNVHPVIRQDEAAGA